MPSPSFAPLHRAVRRLRLALARRVRPAGAPRSPRVRLEGTWLRRLFDSNVVGIALTDLSGAIDQANDAFLQLVGRSRAELETRQVRWDSITPPEHHAIDRRAVEGLRRRGVWPPVEKEYLRPDGSRVSVLVGATLLDHRRERALSLIVDLTARKQAEDALRASEERFRALSAAAPVGIFEMNAEGACTFVNARWQEMTGYSLDEVGGDGWVRIFEPPLRPQVLASWARARARAEPFSMSVPFFTRDGERRWLTGRAVPILDGSARLSGYVGAVEDETERRRHEEERSSLLAREQEARAAAQQADRAKDQFLAVLSHELRNPLAPILAAVELLRRSLPPGDARAMRAAETIGRNARLQARLVDDLLDLSRVTRGKIRLQRSALELGALVSSAAQSFAQEAAEAGIRFEAEPREGHWVEGDSDRLQQVVFNLLSNALKFTARGGRVRLRCAGDAVASRLIVEDTGIGVEAARLPRLFEMFQQGEVGAHRRPGLGIGLALVRSIAELHGGRVWAESEGPGRGSRFVVELPRIPAPAAWPATRLARRGDEEPALLLVEDNPDTRAMLAETLRVLSYRVLTAESGEEALSLLERSCPDAILSDIGLPGIDGYEFLRRARARGARAIPAFAVTGYGQQADAERARAAGFVEHFVKPVDLTALDQHLRARLGLRRETSTSR